MHDDWGGEAASEPLAAVERYRSRPAVELSGAQIGAELVQLRHVVDLVEVEFAKLSGRFAETDEWDGAGFFSPVHGSDLDNLVLLCHRHHWMVHEGRWQIVKHGDGYTTIPPPYRVDEWTRAPGRDWVA